ncbi:GntR family transcriptional regulator [Paracoccus homiensis]|uniref:DNA-binding transcriptional regulator, GntR family n=1 Tax=Paracoccus homiensis TaxID=364199 RepID=A0A1I0J691_9RHOB|nr:GntR family transcriptional regulator [Paracoccus homiensis]SEU05414.1 DNA-binding transcriptional regulator, GntR family [Paracoccus homiensis]
MSKRSSMEISAETEGGTAPIYERIRNDILSGVLAANERLKISELAKRHNTSTNPIREVLQQLRGEGLVLFTLNQGARVRPIDMDFVRDVAEVGYQLEPYLLKVFVETASAEDIQELERIQSEIEALNFADKARHTALNNAFHEYMYDRHYNRVAVELWKQHRSILGAISTRVPIALGRREAILREHRELIDAVRRQDVAKSQEILSRHIGDAGRHLVDQLRIEQARSGRGDHG